MTFNLHSAYVMGESGEGVFQNRFNYMSGRWITIVGATSSPPKGGYKGMDGSHQLCQDNFL